MKNSARREGHRRWRRSAFYAFLAGVFLTGFVLSPQGVSAAELTPERLTQSDKEPQNWFSYYGGYRAWAHSALSQISRENISQLSPAWAFSAGEKGLGSAPLVIDGVMYLLAPSGTIFALDAATGRLIWKHVHQGPPQPAIRPVLGLAAGPGLIFLTTWDYHLQAFDIKTGEEVWDVQIGDPKQCACAPGWSPVLFKDKVVVGMRSESGTRGHISAYDAKTGKLVWRFYTIPAPGERGHETWPEELWSSGSGSTWFPGSFDPELNLVYWGVANPGPMLGGTYPGDKLWTESVVAIDADTGKLRWGFQEIPNDKFDFDAQYEPILVDAVIEGKPRKLVIHSNKGGYAYVLDRVTGAFIRAFPYAANINWTKGIGPDGKPLDVVKLSKTQDTLVCPGGFGSRHSSYNPGSGLWYTFSYEQCGVYRDADSPKPEEGRSLTAAISVGRKEAMKPFVAAFDPITGKLVWRHFTEGLHFSSLLSTGGNLLFGGGIYGDFWALDADTGKQLWAFNTGSGISGVPISYAVEGRQYVAVGSGVSSYSPMLYNGTMSPEELARLPPVGSTLFVFALPAGATERKAP